MRISKSSKKKNSGSANITNGSQFSSGRNQRKELPEVTVYMKDIVLGAQDKYGHWWTKFTPDESYGWWPKYPVGIKETLLGTEGEINGITSFGGSSAKEAHHGDTSGDKHKVYSEKSDSQPKVQDEMRKFAHAYSGEWRWTFGFGQNCHTFQKDMLKQSNLKVEKV
jgi:hypothetical protein